MFKLLDWKIILPKAIPICATVFWGKKKKKRNKDKKQYLICMA